MYVFKDEIISTFTQKEDVYEVTSDAYWIFLTTLIVDAYQVVISSVNYCN